MAGDMPSLGDLSRGLEREDGSFDGGTFVPTRSPPQDISALFDIDGYYSYDPVIDPELLGIREKCKAAEDAVEDEAADMQEDLAAMGSSSATSNNELRPLLGIPKEDITTYPLEERPSKRIRFTDAEEEIHDARDNKDLRNAVLAAYADFKTDDPSYQQKTNLANVVEISFEETDDWFRERRSGMRPTPASQFTGNEEQHNGKESTVFESHGQNPDCFSQAGVQSVASPTNTSISTQGQPCHCTFEGCSETFKSPSSWERHERDVHWAQNKFMCLLCAVSMTSTPENSQCTACHENFSILSHCLDHVLQCEPARTQHTVRRKRHTGLKYHLETEHTGDELKRSQFEKARKSEDWNFPVDSNWPRKCTYINCEKEFQGWKERVRHYTGNHFPKFKRSSRRSVVST